MFIHEAHISEKRMAAQRIIESCDLKKPLHDEGYNLQITKENYHEAPPF